MLVCEARARSGEIGGRLGGGCGANEGESGSGSGRKKKGREGEKGISWGGAAPALGVLGGRGRRREEGSGGRGSGGGVVEETGEKRLKLMLYLPS